jgi:methyl-accepting chemotaxis protein
MHDPLAGVLLALTIVIGVGVLVLIAMLAGLAVAAMKTRKKLHALIEQYETNVAPHVGPMAQQARALVDDLSPKIRSVVDDVSPRIKHIAANLSEISDKVREETQHISVQVNDVVDRTHQQAARVDHIVSSTLNGIGYATSAVQEGLSVPIRHLSGVLEGLRAGVGHLFRKDKDHNHHRTDFSTAIVETVEVQQEPAAYK